MTKRDRRENLVYDFEDKCVVTGLSTFSHIHCAMLTKPASLCACPSSFRPTGMPSTASSGTLKAGAPNSEETQLNATSPVGKGVLRAAAVRGAGPTEAKLIKASPRDDNS